MRAFRRIKEYSVAISFWFVIGVIGFFVVQNEVVRNWSKWKDGVYAVAAFAVFVGACWTVIINSVVDRRRPCKHGTGGTVHNTTKCEACSTEIEEQQRQRNIEHERQRKVAESEREEAERKRQQDRENWINNIRRSEYLKSMHPREFEMLVCSLFRKMGYTAEETPYTGDNGIDGILFKDGHKSVLQCKRVQGSVGEPVLRDLFGAMHHTGSDSAIVVTTGRVSQQARLWASGKPIRIIELSELMDLIAANSPDGDIVPPDFAPRETGLCPKCHSPLHVVNGRRGKFIGCTAYPACRHTERYEPRAL